MYPRTMTVNRGIALSGGIALVSGLILFRLVDIPFGPLFDGLVLTCSFSAAFALILATLRIFRSPRAGIRITGILPAIGACLLILLPAAALNDVRVLHYRSIPPSPSSRGWNLDVLSLARQMEERHANLFSQVPEKEWRDAVWRIQKGVEGRRESDIVMDLFSLAALPNDNHTFPFIMAPAFRLHSFPLVLFDFPDGWYVVKGGRGYGHLAGSRLVSIEGKPIETIVRDNSLLLSAENEWARKERFTYMLTLAEWLLYHNIITDVEAARFVFERANGERVDVMVPSVQFYPYFLWANLFSIDNDDPCVFTNPRKDSYTFRTIPTAKTVYIQFNQSVNQPGRESVDEFARSLENVINESDIERCILDLRNNDGGDPVHGELLRVLRDNRKINQRGRLLVLIGRRTHSAAVMFATQLQMQTSAVFIGEPTAQGPQFFSRPVIITLPSSGLPFAVSTRRTIAGLPFDDRTTILPDVSVAYGIDDFREGRDPVMAFALAYSPPGEAGDPVPSAMGRSVEGRYIHQETLVMDIQTTSDGLSVRISDHIPQTSVVFWSDLYLVSDTELGTRMSDVSLAFPDEAGRPPRQAILKWFGNTRIAFQEVHQDSVIPFEVLSRGDVPAACDLFRKYADRQRRAYPDLERILNRLGYQYLRRNEVAQALDIFSLNVDLFPVSANVYDSYGEGLMVSGQIDSAIASYSRSLQLNPDNTNAANVIKKLTELTE